MLNWKLGQPGQGYSQRGEVIEASIQVAVKIGLGDISKPETWDQGRQTLMRTPACTPTAQVGFLFLTDIK